MRQMIYVVGEPGIGKSTAMAQATAGWQRATEPSEHGWPRRDLLWRPGVEDWPTAVELGYRRDTFSGTDALPMNAITGAIDYMAYMATSASPEADLVLAEGARLGVKRFLMSCVEYGWNVRVLYLSAPAEVAASRRKRRGSHQNEAWLRGARTRAERLAGWVSEQRAGGLSVYYGDAAGDHRATAVLKEMIQEFLDERADHATI
jgi:hypothetical protein